MSSKNKTQDQAAPAPKADPKALLAKYHVKNKYDPYSLKFSLDEYITDTVLKKYPTKEIHRFSTYKISLGVLIAALMLLSHFYPLRFPENFYLLLGCCVSYYVLSGIYTYYDEKIVRDTFVEFLFPYDSRSTSSKTKRIRFGSKIDLYSDVYQFNIEYLGANQTGAAPQKIEHKLYVGNYFDTDGKPEFAAIEKFLDGVMNNLKTA